MDFGFWIFREISYHLRTGKLLADISLTELRNILLSHLNQLYVFYGEVKGVLIARKHVGWYLKPRFVTLGDTSGEKQIRQSFNRMESTKAQLLSIQNFFDSLTNKKDVAA